MTHIVRQQLISCNKQQFLCISLHAVQQTDFKTKQDELVACFSAHHDKKANELSEVQNQVTNKQEGVLANWPTREFPTSAEESRKEKKEISNRIVELTAILSQMNSKADNRKEDVELNSDAESNEIGAAANHSDSGIVNVLEAVAKLIDDLINENVIELKQRSNQTAHTRKVVETATGYTLYASNWRYFYRETG